MFSLAILATAVIGAFFLTLVIPPITFGINSSLQVLRLVEFVFAISCIIGIAPYLIYQFQKRNKLEHDVNHYVKNKIQEVVLQIGLVKAEIENDPSVHLSRLQMLDVAIDNCKIVATSLNKKMITNSLNKNISREFTPIVSVPET